MIENSFHNFVISLNFVFKLILFFNKLLIQFSSTVKLKFHLLNFLDTALGTLLDLQFFSNQIRRLNI